MSEQDSADAASRERRSLRPWLVSGLVVIVAAAAVLTWLVLRETGPQAKPGHAFVAPLDTVHGTTAEVWVPWGRLTLTIGSPREELPENLRKEHKSAPEDGGFIGLSLAVGEAKSMLAVPFVEGGRYRAPRITLVADGRRYPVPKLARWTVVRDGGMLRFDTSQDVFLALADMPEKVSVRISYAGMTQTVSSSGHVEPGRFAALRDITRTSEPVPCGEPYRSLPKTALYEPATCTLKEMARLPYVAGLGWADRGHEWLVIVTDIEQPLIDYYSSGRLRIDSLDSEYTTTEYTMNGQSPVAQVKVNQVGPGLKIALPSEPDLIVFRIPKDAEDLRLEATSTFRTLPDGTGVSVSWRVALD